MRLLDYLTSLAVAGVVFAGTYYAIAPNGEDDEAYWREKERAVALEREVREALDCEKTVAVAADACETGRPLSALDEAGKTLFSEANPDFHGKAELKLTCMKDDTWNLMQVDFRAKGETAWRPLTKKPILCTGCRGDVAITARNPFLIASFVNGQAGEGLNPIREAVLNTPESAERICALDGVHTRVEQVDGVSQFNGGNTGWRDPSAKTLTYWDKSAGRWLTRNAGELGNQWIANIRCGCPYR